MKTAILYLRVSTDEQALRGYSLRAQQELLTNYCKLHGIGITKIFQEDHSAKSFKRPEWLKLITYLRKHRSDFLLFTKWDRFSRNTCDAYQMLANLKRMGTNPQAIEQPLDLNVPENKLVLALYLAVPEIENDRRSLNTQMGMRRAKKEGHWSGKAPLGYKNKTYEDGKKYIALEEPYASAIKWAFQELSSGMSSMAEVHRKAFKLGLTCSINNFHSLVRNHIYCGKIRVREIDGEEEHIIKGVHEPLITEKLFEKVQSVLGGDLKPKKSAIAAPEDLPLRGFLKCPSCHRMLTGSASKGRRNHVAYYHCKSPCKVRFNANKVNEDFIEELKLFRVAKNDQPKFVQGIVNTYEKIIKTASSAKRDCIDELHTLDEQIINTRELLLAGKIEPTDFKNLKTDYDNKVYTINLRLNALKERFKDRINIQPMVINAIKTLCSLPKLYQTATIEDKRYLVETIFFGKLIYDKDGYRTINLNSIAAITYLKNKELQRQKKRGKVSLKDPFPQLRVDHSPDKQ